MVKGKSFSFHRTCINQVTQGLTFSFAKFEEEKKL